MSIRLARAKLAEAVGKAWEDLKVEHPNQVVAFEAAASGGPAANLIATLQDDDEYQALVEATDSEASIVSLVETVAPMVLRVVLAVAGG